MSLTDIQNQLARGAVLALLKDGTKASDSTISLAIRTQTPIQVTHDQIKSAMRWLEGQGLVSIEDVGRYMVAKIREAGTDYLDGRLYVDGIKRMTE